MKHLSAKDLKTLSVALYYLHVSELKEICSKLKLPANGKKGEIIQRILTFLKVGKVIKTPQLPEISKAKKGKTYPLSPKTLILHGAYKNDLKTRKFMKKLVGSHFHFTAFGQDWIKEKWFRGDPPTYMEFAEFWQKEHLARKEKKAKPKEEWAYLTFIQRYLKKRPKGSKAKIAFEWEKERSAQKEKAEEVLMKII